jgi:hypothetical protein
MQNSYNFDLYARKIEIILLVRKKNEIILHICKKDSICTIILNTAKRFQIKTKIIRQEITRGSPHCVL